MRDGPRELDDRLAGALALPPVLVEVELQTEREGAGERAVNHLSIIHDGGGELPPELDFTLTFAPGEIAGHSPRFTKT